MANQNVTLLGFWGSPYSRRVQTALELKGVKYEYVETDLANKSPELLKYNPIHKKVPVLIHEGKPIVESQVILEYIDETWSDTKCHLLPQDPYERSKARFLAKFIDDKCSPSIMKACETDDEKASEELKECLSVLDKELEGKKFFGGEHIGHVDIVANFIAHWFIAIQEASGKEFMTEETCPSLCSWIDRYVNCDTVKENLPPRESMIPFYKRRFEMARASKS